MMVGVLSTYLGQVLRGGNEEDEALLMSACARRLYVQDSSVVCERKEDFAICGLEGAGGKTSVEK